MQKKKIHSFQYADVLDILFYPLMWKKYQCYNMIWQYGILYNIMCKNVQYQTAQICVI